MQISEAQDNIFIEEAAGVADATEALNENIDPTYEELDAPMLEVQENVTLQEVQRTAVATEVMEDIESTETIVDNDTAISHQDLVDVAFADLHPITSITGLSDKLKELEQLKTVLSSGRGFAQYYLWNDGNPSREDRTNYFVTLVDGTDYIKVCDNADEDVIGVVVSANDAGFIGGQSDDVIANGYKYGLVCLIGHALVRRVSSVQLGDYVIPNALGMAQTSSLDAKVAVPYFQSVRITNQTRYHLAHLPQENTLSVYLLKEDGTLGEVVTVGAMAVDKTIAINGTSVEVVVGNNGFNEDNQLFFIYKYESPRNLGYKVTSISHSAGVDYAQINLVPNGNALAWIEENINTLSKRIITNEGNITIALNRANDAYELAELGGGQANAELIDRLDRIESDVEQTQDIANSAVDNAVLRAEAIAGDAVIVAEELVRAAQLDIDKAHQDINTANQMISDIKKITYPISIWENAEGGVGAEYLLEYIDNGLATKAEVQAVDTDVESAYTAIAQNAKEIQLMASSIQKYCVGEYSQAHNLTLDEAKSILPNGIIYAPSQDHTEKYEVDGDYMTQVFYRGFSYEWNGTSWEESTVENVSFVDVYINPPAGELASYWCTGNSSFEYDGTTYEKNTLYRGAQGQWTKVGSLSDSSVARIVSAVRVLANEIAFEVIGDDTYAGLKARVDEAEASIESIANLDTDDGSALALLKQQVDNNAANISQLTEFTYTVATDFQKLSGEPAEGTYYSELPIWDENANKWVFIGYTFNKPIVYDGVPYCYAKNPDNEQTYLQYICDEGNQWYVAEKGIGKSLTAIQQHADAMGSEVDIFAQHCDDQGVLKWASIVAAADNDTSTLTLSADRINFEGAVTFEALDDDVADKINNSIASTEIKYALSDGCDPEDAPTTGWSTTAPAWESGKYMWQQTTITYTDTTKAATVTTTCIQGAKGEDGYTPIKGVDYFDGSSGEDGTSIIWKGTCESEPSNPENGWAYYNSTARKSYVYQDNTWYQMSVDGVDGQNGTDGTSIVWKGELGSPPSSPQVNWVYKDTDDGKVYIYNGTSWEIMVLDGSDGADGTDGSDGLSVFITYNDSTETPDTPTGDGTSDGWHTAATSDSVWMSQKVAASASDGIWGAPIKIKGQDGADGQDGRTPVLGVDYFNGTNGEDGTSIIWKGDYTTAPSNPENGWAYYNSVAHASYTYQDGTWYQMSVDGVDGQDGTNGASIVWKGEYDAWPVDQTPEENWVYKDKTDGVVYIYKDAGWEPMVLDGSDGADGADGADGLSVFITYNDSITMPSVPTGNGTTDGWHTDATSNSVWMSQKVAKSASDGTWGTPIKIKGQDGVDGYTPVKGVDYFDGTNGADGTSVVWKGTFAVAPSDPENGWAYYNSTAKASYVYQGGSWYQMSIDGVDGQNGTDGVSIVWKGELTSPPSSPQSNWVYKDVDDGKVYIYNGTGWELMVLDGSDGQDGADGADGLSVFITYNDSTTTPSTPTGDGTSGGWHTAATSDSVWMSQKVAASASDGTWGTPIKIKGQDGANGNPGVSVTGVIPQYCISTNNATEPTSGWEENFDKILNDYYDAKKAAKEEELNTTYYIWSREKITYSSGNPTYSTATVNNANSVIASWCDVNDKTKINGSNIATGTVTADQIDTTTLIVGKNIQMGENARISWNNVDDQPTIPGESDITTITQNTVTSTYISGLNLTVGNEITMGENAKISWGNVDSKPDVATKDDVSTAETNATSAAVSAIENKGYQTASQVTQITQDTVTSTYISGLQLKVGEEILMGENATISWEKIDNPPDVATKTDATTISQTEIGKAKIRADQIEGNTLSAIRANLGTVNAGCINIGGNSDSNLGGNIVVWDTTFGLEYELSEDEDYYIVAGIGTCTDEELIIPATYGGLPVKTIKEEAFKDNTTITSVVIPNSVTNIGDSAFEGCVNLTNISLPSCSKHIGMLFGGSYVTEQPEEYHLAIEVADGENTIVQYWTYNIPESLTSVTIHGGETVYEYMFNNCKHLVSVDIGSSIASIGNNAFHGCSSLKNITLPFVGAIRNGTQNDHFGYIFGASSYENNADYIPTGLKNVVITGGIRIGKSAFYGCNSLESITLPFVGSSIADNAVATYFGYIFGASSYEEHTTYVPKALKTVVITGGNKIGDYAFSHCESLINIVIPNSATNIGERAFEYCKSLISMVIPDSVTQINQGAFRYCESLTDIDIANSVSQIGDGVFACCESLTSIIIPDGVPKIGIALFGGCTALTSIILPKSITSFGLGAFAVTNPYAIYYKGTVADWNKIGDSLKHITDHATIYYYSDDTPANDGNNYWHYSNVYDDAVIQNDGNTHIIKSKYFNVLSDGTIEATKGVFSGELNAATGSFAGTISVNDGAFYVNRDGKLYASSVNLGTGDIGSSDSICLSTTNMTGPSNFFPDTSSGISVARENWRMTVGDKFGVTSDGSLYASEAKISGVINAISGSISRWDINNAGITGIAYPPDSTTSTRINVGFSPGNKGDSYYFYDNDHKTVSLFVGTNSSVLETGGLVNAQFMVYADGTTKASTIIMDDPNSIIIMGDPDSAFLGSAVAKQLKITKDGIVYQSKAQNATQTTRLSKTWEQLL